ncbi:MAG TPA: DinB family protein [Dehalococcoidia bacterium]|nr:DinB family protein [Dehalococcoidia bacterium]
MNVQSTVRQQLAFWHGVLDQMLADCSQEVLHKSLPGATITSIAPIYAHVVFGADALVNGLLQGKPIIYEAQGWSSKTGVPFPGFPPAIKPEWASTVNMDLPAFQEYARTVLAEADAYLGSLPDSELERKVALPFGGEQTIGWIVINILGTHAAQHAGEIAALKGIQGLKGLPF